jgi:hypothetical protein
MGELKNAYKIVFGISERRSSIRRYRFRWKDNVKIYLKEMGCEGVNRRKKVIKYRVP